MIKSHQAKIWKEAFKFWNRVHVENKKRSSNILRVPESSFDFHVKETQSTVSIGKVYEKKNKTK